jgi:hypothetical protein
MTSYSPRIYIYKITFEEVPYYYYGVHKENKFNENYWGRPVTHKWCWKHYTPKKQILELFEYSGEGWIEAQEVEKRLIKPFYNNDKWCLNENVGGIISFKQSKKGGQKSYKLKLGVHGRSKEQMTEDGKVNGKKIVDLQLGIHGYTKEQTIENAKKAGQKCKELGLGICGLSFEQRSENGKKYNHLGRETQKKCGTGFYGIPIEKRREYAKKSAITNERNKTGVYAFTTEERRENVKITNSQKWECCITGYVSTAAGVVSYQKGKCIDISKNNRRRIS